MYKYYKDIESWLDIDQSTKLDVEHREYNTRNKMQCYPFIRHVIARLTRVAQSGCDKSGRSVSG